MPRALLSAFPRQHLGARGPEGPEGMTLQTYLGGSGTQRKRQPSGHEGEAQASPRGRDGSHTHLGIGVQTRMKALALTIVPRGPVLTSGKAGGGGLEKHTTQEGGAQQGPGTHTLQAGGLAGTAQGPSEPALNGPRRPR